MKLVDFIADLEKKKAVIQNTPSGGFLLDSTSLKNFEKKLFECEEFKNVARINFIEMPTYLVDEESGEPIATNREFLGGKTKASEVQSFMVNSGQEIKFNKIVDLYTITLNKRFNSKEDISQPGIWVYPTSYDKDTFEATNQIRVIWDPKQLAEALQMVGNSETPKQRLMRMFETALDSAEPNLPCEYVLSLRCSSRSIENGDEIKKLDLQPVNDGGDAGPM
jgi:hypothetical protein